MKKIFLFFACIIASITIVKSQNISEVKFRLDGNNIVINYSLELPIDKNAEVEVFVSKNNGQTYEGPLKALTGDVGLVVSSGAKTITWKVFEEYSSLSGDVSFNVKAKLINKKIPYEKLIAYNISGTSALGFTYGMVARWGWYARIKSNASFKNSDLETDGTKIIDYKGDGYYAFTEQVKRSRFAISVGGLRRLNKVSYLYAGVGYGSRTLLWNVDEFSYDNNQNTGNYWLKHQDKSASGLEIEVGYIYRIKKINLSIGANAVGFKFFEANAGIGIFL